MSTKIINHFRARLTGKRVPLAEVHPFFDVVKGVTPRMDTIQEYRIEARWGASFTLDNQLMSFEELYDEATKTLERQFIHFIYDDLHELLSELKIAIMNHDYRTANELVNKIMDETS